MDDMPSGLEHSQSQHSHRRTRTSRRTPYKPIGVYTGSRRQDERILAREPHCSQYWACLRTESATRQNAHQYEETVEQRPSTPVRLIPAAPERQTRRTQGHVVRNHYSIYSPQTESTPHEPYTPKPEEPNKPDAWIKQESLLSEDISLGGLLTGINC
jgi:hypothetical protein